MEKIRIEVDKVILYYMDRVDPDGNLYRFYVYKDMASEIEYFCTEEAGNMTIPIGEGKYIEIVPKEIEKIPVRGYRKLAGIWNRETCNGKGCQTYCISDSPSNRYCLIGPIECNEKLIEVFKKGITVKLKYVEKRVLDAFTDNGIDLSNYTHCIIVKRNFYLAW